MRPCEMGEAATRTVPWNEDQGGLSPDSYRQPLGDVKLTACTAQLKISSSTFYSKPWPCSMLSAPRVGGQAGILCSRPPGCELRTALSSI